MGTFIFAFALRLLLVDKMVFVCLNVFVFLVILVFRIVANRFWQDKESGAFTQDL